jgi:hypothetical protein
MVARREARPGAAPLDAHCLDGEDERWQRRMDEGFG